MSLTTNHERRDGTPIMFEGERIYRVTATYVGEQTETFDVAADDEWKARSAFMLVQTIDFPSGSTIEFAVTRVEGAAATRDSDAASEDASTETREILIHLNVEAPRADTRTADQIADAILGALEVGSDDESVADLKIVCPMAEEV